MLDLERWRALLQLTGNARNADRLFSQIIQAYSEKHRAYHNISHIEHCLTEFDFVRDSLEKPDEAELALWLHDIVYNPVSIKNEQKSAQWAASALKKAGVSETRIAKISDFILATRRDVIPKEPDARFLVDIDLAILGARQEAYRAYEKGIRQEYKWVPSLIYHRKRAEILKSFLDRGSIYSTGHFRQKYEVRARENIERSLAKLSK